jgi:formylglycine-generating enzyme required for sulfatase activity
MSGPRLLDPVSTAAVVIGAHDWSEAGLGRAPSFLRSAKGLVRYLIDSAGLDLDPTLVLDLFDDPASAGEQLARIRETLDALLRERRDEGRPVADVLVYYVGHGHTDDQNHLSLLVRRSRRGMEAETGIKAPDLARVLRVAAPQQRRMIVLDCCFSEAAARDFIGQGGALDQAVAATAMKDLRDDQPQRGTLLLCSSPVGEVSMGAPNAARTLFTGAVLDVLTKGAEGKPPTLSFADLRDAAHEQMVVSFGANAPRPVLHQVNAAHGDLTRTPAFPNRVTAISATREVPPSRTAEQALPPAHKLHSANNVVQPDTSDAGLAETRLWATGKAPDWVTDWGRDAKGPWASFSVTGRDGTSAVQRLRWIPPGRFLMGSPETEKGRYNNEGPQHDVVFANGFWLFETTCTEALWEAVMGPPPGPRRGARFPVTGVSWEDAQAFIRTLNAALPGIALALPSEAQWEYACRAGTGTPYSFGTAITREQVCYGSSGPVEVGSLPANGWGLHEMHGNVWEWCEDHWHASYQGAPTDGSAWVDTGGAAARVIRGGSWLGFARDVRAACRDHYAPANRGDDLGFRCARVQSDSAVSVMERRAGRSKPGERSEPAATSSPQRRR